MIKKFENFINEPHNDVDISTIGIDDAHKLLDDGMGPNEVALIVATDDEELLDNFISKIFENPALIDRFTRMFKIVK